MGPDPLGIFSAAVLQPKDLNLASGDRFFLYTDGLIEATLLFLKHSSGRECTDSSFSGSERESDKEAISCGFRYGLKSHEFDVRHGDPFGL
jgi:hypothetical protein